MCERGRERGGGGEIEGRGGSKGKDERERGGEREG